MLKELLSRKSTKEFQTKGLEEPIFLSKISALERAKFLDSTKGDEDTSYENFTRSMALLVQLSLCDNSGNRIYAQNEIDELMNVDGDRLQEIYKLSADYNGLLPESVPEAGKNSGTIQSSDS